MTLSPAYLPPLTRRSRRLALATFGLLAILAALLAPSAQASIIFRPVSASGNALVFRLSGLKPARVRSARLVWGPVRVRVSRAKVVRALRRHKLLRVRKPRARLARRRRPRAPRPAPAAGAPVPTPAGAPVPAGTPTPAAAPVPSLPPVSQASLVVTAAPAPAPTPAPASGPTGSSDPGPIASGSELNPGCGPAFGSFASGANPPGCWRPYSASSPFNREIPAGAPLDANSSGVVSRLLGFGSIQNLVAGQGGTSGDWYRPLYWSKASDPVFVLHCTESWGVCPLEGKAIHIPDGARPAGGSDGHMTVIDQAAGTEYDFWQVASKPAGGGVLVMSWGGMTSISGDGRGSGAVAAGYGTAAGLLREEELASGHINHALFISVQCDSGSAVYPAAKGGAACSDPTNAPPQGTRFQLAMSDPQIDALGVPGWKKTILRAMAHYGLIVGDTGGSWQLEAESGVAYTSVGQTDKWVQFARSQGVPYYAPDNNYVFNLRDGVDWARYLRVVAPCVSQGSC